MTTLPVIAATWIALAVGVWIGLTIAGIAYLVTFIHKQSH